MNECSLFVCFYITFSNKRFKSKLLLFPFVHPFSLLRPAIFGEFKINFKFTPRCSSGGPQSQSVTLNDLASLEFLEMQMLQGDNMDDYTHVVKGKTYKGYKN